MEFGFDFETRDFETELEDFTVKKTKKFTRIFEVGPGGSVSYCGIRGDKVYFGACEGFLYCLETETGEEKWRFKTGGIIIEQPKFYEDKVMVGSFDGYLYCVNSDTGKELWRFKTSDKVYSSGNVSEGVIYFGSVDNF
ncbi:MAG: PQQ-like beta-propeller repeat protein, partial [Candidatus Aenigmarchaeota archaeon]|nr:PQQ-like beta-propeller repeat protein [Candidatus Aenigmarchaeota archaeon]